MKYLPEEKGVPEPRHLSLVRQPLDSGSFQQLLDEYREAAPALNIPPQIAPLDWSKDYGSAAGIDWDRKYSDEELLFPDEPPLEPASLNHESDNIEANWGPPVSADRTPLPVTFVTDDSDPDRKAFKRHIRRHNYLQDLKAKVVPGELHYKYDTDSRFEAFKQRRETKQQQGWRRIGRAVLGMGEKKPARTDTKVSNFLIGAAHTIAQRTGEIAGGLINSKEALRHKGVKRGIVVGALAVAAAAAGYVLEQKGVSLSAFLPHSGPKNGSIEANNALHFLPTKLQPKNAGQQLGNYVSHLSHASFEPAPVHFDIQAGGNLSQSVHQTLVNLGAKDPAGSTARVVSYIQFQQGNSLNLVHSGDSFTVPINTLKELIN